MIKQFLISAQISANICPLDESSRSIHNPSTVHSLTQQVVFFWANDALDQDAFKKTGKKLDTTCNNKAFMT